MTSWDQSRTPRILIVDDNPSIHRDFDLVLADNAPDTDLEADEQRLYGDHAPATVPKPEYVLEHAFSGLEGVDKVRVALGRGEPFQLAFVDIRMPGIDGVETIDRLWQVDPRVQVVICTAFSDYSEEDLARRLGRNDKLLLLKKPFDTIEIAQLASTLTEKWYLARQAALRFEQMEVLVAERTRRLLALQVEGVVGGGKEERLEAGGNLGRGEEEPPLVLLVSGQPEVWAEVRQAAEPGCRLLVAKDSERGLHQAQETVPDLIIAELLLAGLDGVGLCRRLKGNELTSHIPVLVVGGGDGEDAQLKALEAGADDYLCKPLKASLLKSRVDNLLRFSRRLRDQAGQESTWQARDLARNQVDAVFLRRALETIEEHLADFEFDVESLARKLAVSRRQLFRKLAAVTGCTPNMLIRNLRLSRAAQMLKDSQLTVSEITYAVGFADLKHFRTVFREHFGVLPGDYPKRTVEGH